MIICVEDSDNDFTYLTYATKIGSDDVRGIQVPTGKLIPQSILEVNSYIKFGDVFYRGIPANENPMDVFASRLEQATTVICSADNKSNDLMEKLFQKLEKQSEHQVIVEER